MSERRLFDIFLVLVMAATLAAVTVMASISAFDAHPDEKDHVSAGRYYMQHWDPPGPGDPRAAGTYSNYGVSYLHQLDVVYFLAGKFAAVAAPLTGQDHLALRFFNVGLFALLLVLAWRLPPGARICFLPLFVSPQVWYVFSYFNGDALPLTLCFMAGFCVLRIKEKPRAWRYGVWLGACLGLLACSKMNYLVFLGFAGMFWLAAAVRGDRPVPWGRGLAITLVVALGLFDLRYGAHLAAMNAAPPAAPAPAGQLQPPQPQPPAQPGASARSGESPQPQASTQSGISTPPQGAVADPAQPQLANGDTREVRDERFWGMRMRSKGVSLEEMISVRKWHIWSQRTSFGAYGPMTIFAPFGYYRLITWMFVLFAGLVCWPVARAGLKGKLDVGLVLMFAALTVGQSLWHSWNQDFQAQGRYFFPILGMLAYLMIRHRNAYDWSRPALWGCGLTMWAMSLWSFVNVGIAEIAR